MSTVAAVTETKVGFYECLLFKNTAVSTLAKLSSESVQGGNSGGLCYTLKFSACLVIIA